MSPPFDSWAADHSFPAKNQNPPSQPQKKPRHRHSPAQLAALNELFDQNDHPPLEQRTALAEHLRMETKTVNAWFQNKRASSKKRIRGGAQTYEAQRINTPPILHPPPPTLPEFHPQPDLDDIHDDEYSVDVHHSRATSAVPSDYPSSFYATHPDQGHFYAESDSMPRRMRMRPSSEQTEELRKLYNINPHPTTEQRQVLSANIGMRYQSITNWFQNQRSLAKKRKEDEPDGLPLVAPQADYPQGIRHYSAYPPPSHPHPSLGLPPQTGHPSLLNLPLLRRSPSVSPSTEDHSPQRSFSHSHRSTTPYGNLSSSFGRPRRSRPEPYQLDALKELFTKTSTPTIEERSALALEIGMDVGKVTNWFRNLRQTARKRAKRSGSGDDDDDDSFLARDPNSASASRFGTPTFGSSSSSINEYSMELDDYDIHHHSDNGSEDDYQEAVTPSPEQSPSPPPAAIANPPMKYSNKMDSLNDSCPVQMDKVSTRKFADVDVADAELLLIFHRHVVH
ncbi:hypothetical protein M413DRAFT_62953 [Hebeloma cylindrosporum]|uniref:Homeobox domain-containing protein n=1 Tax=Hebeloma cylindrosporum TaxID=76867 RepID=A0A0C2YCN9_HEBCY|nr:hypothetical protein M413DRAFT_62953 [Hebeloma cylindrosporum h7]